MIWYAEAWAVRLAMTYRKRLFAVTSRKPRAVGFVMEWKGGRK